MAEAAVSSALQTLGVSLLEEARLLYGVKKKVRELETQKCFLENADRRRHERKTIFNCISEIRDLAQRAEDAIERHEAYQASSSRSRGLIQQVLCNCMSVLQEWYSIHLLGSEISTIKSGLEKINKEMVKKSIIGGESSSSNNRARKSFPEFEIGDCFVGMEKELKQLRNLLRQDNEERVISVWGMGGLGKTTIAKKLYNEKKMSFDRCAWVCITQQCQFRSVWEDVLKQLELQNKNHDPQIREDVVARLSVSELNERLCKIQREKRCLVVLDDLWETSDWDELKHPFVVHDLKSKILVTTRQQKVAEKGFAVELRCLNMEDALELLVRKAFPQTYIPEFALEENFEKIGKEMVRKCGCLPLAISLLGGVLRMKNSMMEWDSVNRDINKHIYRDEKEIDGVLTLSYESLPYYLKPCILYMDLFEEDEYIACEDLYSRWIAQGMISYDRDNEKTLMDIAELYLSELASRSIVQVSIENDIKPRKYRICKLHDVVRELCLKLGEREDFGLLSLEYQRGKLTTLLRQVSTHMKVRHLAINFRKEVKLEPNELGEDTSKHLRSLQMYNRRLPSEFSLQSIVDFQSVVDFQKFKLLRDLFIVKFKFAGGKLSEGITNLVHLRRLCLRFCEFDKLPLSISNLVYMDTLDLNYARKVEVPNVFKEMLRLKHMLLPTYDEENIGSYRLILDEGVDELESLVGLDSRVHELKCLGRMKNLRRFEAFIHDDESLSAMIDGIAIMGKLLYCRVEIKEGCELGRNEGVLKKAFTCPNLHELWIKVKLGKALAECCGPDLISSKLTMLKLSECEIEDDPMGILGNLPCLKDLCLFSKSFVGEEIICPSSSFPRLKTLLLHRLPNLRKWRVEAGAMSLLSQLSIHECSRMEMVPDGLSGISTLWNLAIRGMAEMGKRVSPSGEDFHKVSHVPSITIYN